MQKGYPCVIMRGGTSKAIFLRRADLPDDEGNREALILRIFGSPDKRQIDGLGGADPLTSKLAFIDKPESCRDICPDADIVYTFGQVEIDHPAIDWLSLCGNITSAVGVYAIEEGFVRPEAPLTRVRVYNTNLGRLLTVEVPVEDGAPVLAGDHVVPGVPGSGGRILVDFSETAGAATGEVLPTGNPVDRLDVPGFGPLDMSLVDTGNAHVFIRARDIGLKGTETASEIDADKALRALLETIRGIGAHRMGMIADPARSRQDSPAVPILGIVSPPAGYRTELDGALVEADSTDLVSRLMFMQQVHKTYAATSTVCTGVAACIPGTLINAVTRPHNRLEIRIGHPAGVIATEAEVEMHRDGPVVRRATLGRTARRILKGEVYVPAAGED